MDHDETFSTIEYINFTYLMNIFSRGYVKLLKYDVICLIKFRRNPHIMRSVVFEPVYLHFIAFSALYVNLL